MSITALKIVALIAMTIDHIGEFIPHTPLCFCWIGRIAAPIFIFCLTEAMRYTKDRKKYIIRLYEMTCICAGIFFITCRITWFFDEEIYPGIIENNIFATLFNIAVLIAVIDSCIAKKRHWKRNLYLYLVWQIGIFMINTYLNQVFMELPVFEQFSEDVRYILYGPLCNITWSEGSWSWVLLGVLFYYAPMKKIIWYPVYSIINIILYNGNIIVKIMHYWSSTGKKILYESGVFVFGILLHENFFFKYPLSLIESYQWMMVLAIIPILFYNGQYGLYGKRLKNVFYIYYPLHIVLLYVIGELQNF